MPYASIQHLPESVRNSLPKHAQEIFKEAFNSAHEQYSDGEDVERRAHRVAWSAVKRTYRKADDEWVEKNEK